MKKNILITGGAGFIGFNSAMYFNTKNYEVHVIDDLSRTGVRQNLIKLKNNKINFYKIDIKNFDNLLKVFKKIKPSIILHQAGQVTVTKSFENPRFDMRSNIEGTLNILECIRILNIKPIFIYPSTNKVYGNLESIKILKSNKKYQYKSLKGINEKMPIFFESPYGCSKGAAEQYVIDYSKTYNFKSFIVRQSCIYGPNQYGQEGQGWISWILMCAIFKKKINVFGNGLQVRDLLFIDDLLEMYELIITKAKYLKSTIFNAGGGIKNSMSILELLDFIKKEFKIKTKHEKKKGRGGDQKIYISDCSKAKKKLGWEVRTNIMQGMYKLKEWILTEKKYLQRVIK
jgi:CDP-paratose 2-epimerase